MKQNITLLGAGLVGSLLAILLQKRGYQVSVLERRGDMRKTTVSAGKSINLAMSVRGWAGLELADLRKEIEEIAIPMFGREIHPVEGDTIFQYYGKNKEAIYSVSRGELNKKLIELAEQKGVQFIFNKRILDVDIDTNTLTIEDTLTKEVSIDKNHELIIASDGAFSALRNAYTKKDRYNYNQFYIEHGYKELHIPAGPNSSFLMEKNALHIWPRKNYMLIALPNIDGSFTCTLFFPFEGNPSFTSLKTKEEITDFFTTQFPDAIALMPTFIEDYLQNPTSSLVTVKCEPWTYEDKNMLIGDAAHAIVPFYGQGMNAGFEDCRQFIEILDASEDKNWKTIFETYQKARKQNGDAVADLALNNFIEMRDKIASPAFLERKKIEKELGILFPNVFNSVYEMVSFSHTPYSIAINSQKAQDKLLENIMQEGDFDSNLSDPIFITKLNQWMQEYAEEIKEITASLI